MPSLPAIAELLADARLAALVAVPQPAMLFGADGGLLFANPGGLKLAGVSALREAAERDVCTLGPVAEAAMRLAPQLPAAGAPRLQRLRLANAMQPQTFAFSRFALADGSEGILAAGLDAAREKTPSLPQAMNVLLDSERDAFALYDLDGQLIEASPLAALAIGDVANLQELHPAAGIALDALRAGKAEELSSEALHFALRRVGTKANGAIVAFFADAEQPEAEAGVTEAEAEAEIVEEPKPAPARFVWRTDKDGIISSVSP